MGLKGNQFSVAVSSLFRDSFRHSELNSSLFKASIFYVGYLVAQAPWAYLIGRYPAGRVLGVSTFVWGLAVITMVFNRNYAGVLVSRFVLGVFEASVTPGLSLMTGFWYTRAEMPLRVGVVFLFLRLNSANESDSPANNLVLQYRLGRNDRCSYGCGNQ